MPTIMMILSGLKDYILTGIDITITGSQDAPPSQEMIAILAYILQGATPKPDLIQLKSPVDSLILAMGTVNNAVKSFHWED